MTGSTLPKMAVHLGRRWFTGHPETPPVDLRGRQVVVTGAGTGSIGYYTAQTMARWGASVLVSSRSRAAAVADQLNLSLPSDCPGRVAGYPLDLTSAVSVNRFAEQVRCYFGDRLDLLMNNAGIHLDLLSEWKTPHLSKDGVEIHWRTNYLGTCHLTRRLLPLLQNGASQTGDARVVNVVSHLHAKAENRYLFKPAEQYNSWQAYGLSKLALIHHAMELERRFGMMGVHGYAVHPGSVYTNIAHHGLAGHGFMQRVRHSLAFVEKRILLTPEQGAQSQLYCATDPAARGGAYYERCAPAQPSPDAMDPAVAAMLWDRTDQWVCEVANAAAPAQRLNGEQQHA
ncbi:MAG: SDR family NAD(P)-dependent oxidoreductase [Ketobacteraceae bacterium]|nr:SDR family NAD(P)-dependent oxidoreductase [Ketobacteraceae bacterium]